MLIRLFNCVVDTSISEKYVAFIFKVQINMVTVYFSETSVGL